MTETQGKLDAGLWFVGTPIGNARDITLRALDVLRDADVLAAEDTRALRRLMEIHGIPLAGRRIHAYHDHNGAQARPALLAELANGRSLAYASEAGMPLVADPGFVLGREAALGGYPVHSVPGPSASLAALSVSGLPSDRFLFMGFVPNADGARRRFFEEVAKVEATLVVFESPRRIGRTLAAAAEVLGGSRDASVCRELTKKFEEVVRGTLAELAERYAKETPKGEIVLCIAKGTAEVAEEDVEAALAKALERTRLKEAAAEIAEQFGLSKRDVYQMGLRLQEQ